MSNVELRQEPALVRGGFRIRASAERSIRGPVRVELSAFSDVGFVLGAGRLLRELRVHSTGLPIHLPRSFELVLNESSRQQIRGTQFTTAAVGPSPTPLRGKFGSWEMAEEYVKALAIFGGNTVELSHLGPGDPYINACLGNWSRLLDNWDVNVHLWLPVDDAVLPFTPAMAQGFTDMLANMTRLDAIHIPGGDGGPGWFSDTWFNAVRTIAKIARRQHPKVKVTCSANYFNESSFAKFLARPWEDWTHRAG